MPRVRRATVVLATTLALTWSTAVAQVARISETRRTILTYPFSEPNPIPILTRDARLYPYHTFEGYAVDGVPREWTVVQLENDYIEVFVLPEVGGKVWGAVVKQTGDEFIYRNEVMKFRNIALRGPWTSGGIEFNFGVIGHTPSTATPVDYAIRENADGSVSCIVGMMDLPSRTHWRVEVRLPADRAYFETNVLWYNPTVLEQPYYNWMTAAAFATEDLVLSIPGNAFLEHGGTARAWPVNAEGRYLPAYANNTFAGHKSYHVVGELNDFFGGFYRDDGYGFGHWARYDQMPGQKLWLWALSREGGVWEDLLTDTDGQYVEYQAGRLFVQYQPGADRNPVTQVGFDAGATDRWSETWFPLLGTGGMVDASRDGAMYAEITDGRLTVRVNAFRELPDTLRVLVDDQVIAEHPVSFTPLEVVERTVRIPPDATYRVTLPGLGLDYRSDPASLRLARPFRTSPEAWSRVPDADRSVFEARELVKGRRYAEARDLFASAVEAEPWHREARLGLADLDYRSGRYESGLEHVHRVLELDTYDAQANFVAGHLYRALERRADAIDAYGWASRSTAYRAVALVQLAEMMLAEGDPDGAVEYARLALRSDRDNLPARQVLAMVARRVGDLDRHADLVSELLSIDPLHHAAAGERLLADRREETRTAFVAGMRGEYPEQTLLEIVIDYARRGAVHDAVALLRVGMAEHGNPLLGAWLAWLERDTTALEHAADVSFVFPYRRETIGVLEWVTSQREHWSWRYLLALNLWAVDRDDEAVTLLRELGDDPDYAPVYVGRAELLERTEGRDPERDLLRAVELDPGNRTIRIHLVRYLQQGDRWSDALAASHDGRRMFPGDFNLDLLHVRSLNHLGRAAEAIEILRTTNVLPSENARESHRLWEQAHVLQALDAIEAGRPAEARPRLLAAMEWPEHLGQGRPYEPEERIPRFLLGIVDGALGDRSAADTAYQAVVARTRALDGGRLALLGVAARAAIGDSDNEALVPGDPGGELARVAGTLRDGIRRAQSPATVVQRLASEAPDLFDDLEGRILLRTMRLMP